jgi:hypothetical protein
LPVGLSAYCRYHTRQMQDSKYAAEGGGHGAIGDARARR